MIHVIDPGFYTSIQDVGRSQFTELGVPRSGCMDLNSSSLANGLLGNGVEDAVLECTMKGPVLEFTQDTYIAMSGAHFEVYLDDVLIENGIVHRVRSNQILKFGKLIKGMRMYLAVAGGIQTDKVLESRSFYVPVTKKPRLEAGDRLFYSTDKEYQIPMTADLPSETILNTTVLDAYRGPEYDILPKEIQEQLLETDWVINKRNNRMAYQFDPPLNPFSIPFITSPVMPGTIQYTPQGSLFALMRDGQTTGGYIRVLQLSEEAINQLAQLKTSDTFRIRFVDFSNNSKR